MAVPFTTDQVNVLETATLVVAANANRRSLLLRVVAGEVWYGPDNTVTVDNGYLVKATDESPIINDSIPTTGDWYAIKRAGTGGAKISYLEIADQ